MLNKALQELYDLKAQTNMTNRQIADLADVPESTVGRILRKETADPRYETVCKMIDAMKGYIAQNKPYHIETAGSDLAVTPDTIQEQAPDKIPIETSDTNSLTQIYKQQIADQEKQIEDLKQQRAELSRQSARNRLRFVLTLLVAACAITFIFALFFIDFMHPGKGWVIR